jgi:hypothetical protein
MHHKAPRWGASRRDGGGWAGRAFGLFGTIVGLAAGAYAVYAGVTWLRYGDPVPPSPDEQDPLLDRFMPTYDVVDRHAIRVEAPAAVTLAAAKAFELMHLPLVRAIFKGREIILGARPAAESRPRGLLDETLALGWGVLAETPGREVVVGAATKPWEANVVFRSIPPGEFAAFDEPEYVKIVWTLRADPLGEGASMYRTETRAVATDAVARERFRRYWACLSPGIRLIRTVSLRPLKEEAERRAMGSAPS